ncbi:outer membrane protein assembly factor BamA [Solilutibacter silvestris]|uniref:outer membrane protein assembly factor BamA n=1 Tax=Solilutibacter silvestris TaxID=1645665 RepID=UPI003D331C18
MMRNPSRHLLALALAAALATPTWAQSIVEPFRVSDIRVDGLQRIAPGTVFTYLAVERGDMLDQAKAEQAIRALYKTGFFSDVKLDRQGDILVVSVEERPAINKVTVTGNKDIKDDDLKKPLKEIGLTEGDTFDPMSLDRVSQELTRQYNNRGKYNVQVTPSVTKLDRNRVDVAIAIKEGKAAKIKHINIIGNEKFTDKQLMRGWESQTTNWSSWYSRDDQYSKEKLSGDVEKLQSYYLDRGYIDADVSQDNTQVTISPDKRAMFITAGLTEGEQYKVSALTISGDTILSKETIQKQFDAFIKPGYVFSRRAMEAATDSVTAMLSNIGYANAQVVPNPTVDREARTVALDMQVQPGPRVNVRRIVFKGNNRTADDVLRREMRQFEGAWYSQAAIDRSKIRLQQLGYFEKVDIESQPVAGAPDQVDLAVNVKETNSGTLSFGVGYSQLGGVMLNGSISERNFLGSGNQLTIALQRSAYQKQISFNFLNPYFTKNGVSLGYNVYYSDTNYADANVANYSSSQGAAQMVLGLPITEWDSVSFMLGVDRKKISANIYTPQPIWDYINAIGHMTFKAARARVAFGRDTRNDALQPSVGMLQRLSLEATLPGSTAKYYTMEYTVSKYWPLSSWLVLNAVGDVGYGNSYGAIRTTTLPDGRIVNSRGLPFFENYYAGGVSSGGRVRGFVDNSLGPQATSDFYSYPQPMGGSFKTVGTLETFFPRIIDSPSARLSAFLDFGNVFKDRAAFKTSELRASTGIALMWRSPMGPISISYAYPLRYQRADKPGQLKDQIERLQFTFSGTF